MSAETKKRDGDTKFVTIRTEFKPLLSAAIVSIEFTRNSMKDSCKLELNESSIQIKNKNWTTIFHMLNLKMKPSKCWSLHWISSRVMQLSIGASLRPEVSAAGDASTANPSETLNDGLFRSSEGHFSQNQLVERIEKCHPHCYCVGCGARILNPNCKFKRVLPLPTENWSDFADIWFCHNHSNGHNSKKSENPLFTHSRCGENTVPDHVKKVQKTGLIPRSDDCLVSSLYMLVSAVQVCPSAIACNGDRLVCKRCANFLGFVKLGDVNGASCLQEYLDDPLNGIYKIYFHTVSFGEDSYNNRPRMLKVPQSVLPVGDNVGSNEQSVEDFVSCLLKDQSKMFTSYRFILHSSPFKSNGQSGIDILIWLLDQEMYVYNAKYADPTVSHSPTQQLASVVRKKTEMAHDRALSERKTSSDDQTISEENIHPHPPTSKKIKSQKCMKVLYDADFCPSNGKRKSPAPQIFSDWQKDNTVHGLSLPQPLCLQIVSLLVNSTKQINTNQRSFNGFKVGFLKAS